MENKAKVVKLIQLTNEIDAHHIMNRLKEEGIESFSDNNNFANLLPGSVGILNLSINIWVNQIDVKRSIEIINESNFSMQVNKEICPQCSSANVKLGYHRHSILNFLIIILFLYYFIIIFQFDVT